MKKLLLAVACIALVGLAPCAFAAQVEVHGDLNNRAQLYTDHANWFQRSGANLQDAQGQFVDLKYRMWAEMATDDNAVKGVYAIEIATTYGDGSSGGAYSGDGINVKTRWAYTDFKLGNGRLKLGLQPWDVNSFVWNETATAVRYEASAGSVDYVLGWARGQNHYANDDNDAFVADQDGLLGRVNFSIGEGSKAGVFVLYQMANPNAATPVDLTSATWYLKSFPGDNADMSFWTVGVDGKLETAGPLFVNWDLLYQNGKIENVTFEDAISGDTSGADTDFDLNAYLVHVDVGVKLGKLKLTYTGWYASGDDDATDNDFNAFLSTDVDRFESIIFMEGGYPDGAAFMDQAYFADKGMFLNRLGVDYQATEKTKVGAAVLYLQTTEDIKYTDDTGVARSSTDLGFELDAYVSYKMYKNLEIALNAGYLLSGDAMDIFDVDANGASYTDGSADEDIFTTTARIRYMF